VSSTTRPPGLASGRVGTRQIVIGPQDTCKAAGTGDLDVLATPRVLALFEGAAIDALGDVLGAGLITVGVRVELEHLLPVAIGGTVRATASLISVRGRRLLFAVRLHDAQERAVGVGRLTRAVVQRETFTPLAQ
jgi:fluoroacetyl-CoA thioesterase